MKEFDAVQEAVLQGTEIVAEQEKKKELRLTQRQRPIKGHILWQYNYTNGILEQAKFNKEDVVIDSLNPIRALKNATVVHKVITNDECFYLQSLNKENAIRKLKKLGFKYFRDAVV